MVARTRRNSNMIPVYKGIVLIGIERALNPKKRNNGKNPYNLNFFGNFLYLKNRNGTNLCSNCPTYGIGQIAHHDLALMGKKTNTKTTHHKIQIRTIVGLNIPIWVLKRPIISSIK